MQFWTHILVGSGLLTLGEAVAVGRGPSEATEETVTRYFNQRKSCCAVLDFFLPGKILYPGNPLYLISLASYYGKQEQEITPSCIVSPDAAQDVATGVFILSIGDRLKLNDCDFAVRSGGHTPWGGAANVETGVTFDLQKLNQVDVSADRKTAAIGPGNRWGNVYPKLDAMKLAMVGGRVSPVGAGGLITGGGISYFSPRKGFACDNIINYQLANANGRLIDVNAKSYPDLFKALKGGTNNFGIVTRFDVNVFEQGDLWGGFQISDLSAQDQHFSFFENFTKAENYDEYASFIVSYAFTSAALPWAFSGLNMIYTKPEPYPAVFKPMTDLPSLANTFKTAPLSAFTDEIAAGSVLPPTAARYYFLTFTIQNSAAVMKEFFLLADAWKKSSTDILGLNGALSYQPMPRTITSKGAASGGNVLGLDNAPDLAVLNMGLAWSLEADDEKMNARLEELIKKADGKAREAGKAHPWIYLNYGAPWQKPIASYGRENVEFLRRVAKKYDPRGLFLRRRPGGFKLDD